MDQVNKCIDKMSEVILAAKEGKFEVIEELTYEVSKLEHQADQIKDDIRESLLKRFFMPIDRGAVLEILSLQDSLADTAEDVCKVLTIRKLPFPDDVRVEFDKFLDLNIKAYSICASIISQLDELIEAQTKEPTAQAKARRARIRRGASQWIPQSTTVPSPSRTPR